MRSYPLLSRLLVGLLLGIAALASLASPFPRSMRMSPQIQPAAPPLLPRKLPSAYLAGGSARGEGEMSGGAGLPLPAIGTLLNEVGKLAQTVPEGQFVNWKQTLRSPRPANGAAVWLHLRVGEYELAHNEQPERARWHFQQAQQHAQVSTPDYGLAAYDTAVALFYSGRYAEAADAFRQLLGPQNRLSGYNRNWCALFSRKAAACASYQAQT
jgi:hypothetical protein